MKFDLKNTIVEGIQSDCSGIIATSGTLVNYCLGAPLAITTTVMPKIN
jgi:hypothetical protein